MFSSRCLVSIRSLLASAHSYSYALGCQHFACRECWSQNSACPDQSCSRRCSPIDALALQGMGVQIDTALQEYACELDKAFERFATPTSAKICSTCKGVLFEDDRHCPCCYLPEKLLKCQSVKHPVSLAKTDFSKPLPKTYSKGGLTRCPVANCNRKLDLDLKHFVSPTNVACSFW